MGAAVPAWLAADIFGAMPPVALIAGAAAYGIAYVALCYAPPIAEPAAIRLPIVDKIKSRFAVGRVPLPAATTSGSGPAVPGEL
jgi:hypothetical protein